MKKFYDKFIDTKYMLYAAIGVALTTPSLAFAQAAGGGGGTAGGGGGTAAAAGTGFSALAQNLTDQMKSVAQIALSGFALLGLFFVGTGLLRLKAAVDSQGQQVKYGEGLWRIGLGALMISVSAILNTTNTSLLGTTGNPNTSLW